jgi:hypothetical protein
LTRLLLVEHTIRIEDLTGTSQARRFGHPATDGPAAAGAGQAAGGASNDLLILAPVVLLSAALAFAMLTKGHDWGDDFAAYLAQAISILHGTMRQAVMTNAFTMRESSRAYGPIATPWGYPALLAPAYLVCGGLNILCLKAFNIPAFAAFLAVFFRFVRRRLALVDSAIVLSLFAFNPELLRFQDNILSDITFLFLSTASALFIETTSVPDHPEGTPWRNVALGAVLFLAFFVRTSGLLLVPTLLATQTIHYRGPHSNRSDWPRVVPIAAIPYLVFGVLTLALLVIFQGGEASFLALYRTMTRRDVINNVWTYLILPGEFFASVPFGNILAGALFPFLAAGIAVSHRQDFTALVYCGLTLLLLITWPSQDGLRYVFPLLPFLVYFSYRGMQSAACVVCQQYRRLGEGAVRTVWLVVVAAFAIGSLQSARTNLDRHRTVNDGPFEPQSAELFEWIRSTTAPDSVVIFFKPRAMRLLTDRAALLVDDCSQLGRGNYVVIRKTGGDTGQLRADEVARCRSVDAARAFENTEYVAYRILPHPR